MGAMNLDYRSELPDALLRISPREIRTIFPRPSLVEIRGRSDEVVFLSVLLHGNETSGFSVLQRLARWSRSHQPPRTLIIFIGNVFATEAGLRHLADQPDYNRIWNGGASPEHALAEEVLSHLRSKDVFAAIDIHNNTGRNPLYGCINELTPDFLHLGAMFGPTLVYFRNPPSVISMALSRLCPAITVEAGMAGDALGIERAFDLVHDTLHLSRFRETGLERPLTVYHTVGRVELAPDCRFGFSPSSDAPLLFPEAMDSWNFTPKSAGTRWARCKGKDLPLRVLNAARDDLTAHFFRREGEHIVLTRDITPSMITLDPTIIRHDCLAYLMEEIDLNAQQEVRRAI